MSSPLTIENFSSVFRGELDSQLRTGPLKRKFDEVDTKIQQTSLRSIPSTNQSYQTQQSLNSLSSKIDGNQGALQAQLADVSRKIDTLCSQTLQQFSDVEDRSERRQEPVIAAIDEITASVKEMTQQASMSLSKTKELEGEIKAVQESLSTKIDANQSAVLGVLSQIMDRLPS